MAKQEKAFAPTAIRWQITEFVNADSTNYKTISGAVSPEGESLVKAISVLNSHSADISFDIGFEDDTVFIPLFRVAIPLNSGVTAPNFDLLRYADMKKLTELDPNGRELLSIWDNGAKLAARPVVAVTSPAVVRFAVLYKPF